MNIGFTGARAGTNTGQLHTLRSYLLENLSDIKSFHHGCCVGADLMAHNEAYNLGIHIVYHPPINTEYQAVRKDGGWEGDWRKPRNYLDRNQDLVSECDVLIGMPAQDKPMRRSGTWSTLRYAERLGKPIYLITPHRTAWIVPPKKR